MEPTLRTPKILPEPLSRVEHSLHAPSTSNTPQSTISTSAAPGLRCSEDLGSTMPNPQQALEPSADDILGQFSFAPATQTTIVTTTTTTTTSFPPLMMKAPLHLHELDPKMYPLASSPTPKSIKRFCFDVGGRPTFFGEADDAGDTMKEVRSSY